MIQLYIALSRLVLPNILPNRLGPHAVARRGQMHAVDGIIGVHFPVQHEKRRQIEIGHAPGLGQFGDFLIEPGDGFIARLQGSALKELTHPAGEQAINQVITQITIGISFLFQL